MTRLLTKGNSKLNSHKKDKKTICKKVGCQKKKVLDLLRKTKQIFLKILVVKIYLIQIKQVMKGLF